MKNTNIFFSILFILSLGSCHKDNADSVLNINQASEFKADVALNWIDLQRELVQYTPGYSSPVAARAYAYAALAMYESIAAGIKDHLSYSGLINGYTGQSMPVAENGKEYNWELVVNACMAVLLKEQFKLAPGDRFKKIDSLEKEYLNQNSGIEMNTRLRSIDYGKKAGLAIYNFSVTDGQDEAYLHNFPDYTIPNTPGHWESTDPKQANPLQAYWGEVRPFLSSNVNDEFIMKYKPTFEFSTDAKSGFYSQALEAYTKAPTDYVTKWVLEFWNEDSGISSTPAGHSIAIAAKVLKIENANLAIAAEVLSKIGITAHDAFVTCWRSKYKFILLRPETFIRYFIDPNYKIPPQNPLSTFSNTSYPAFPSEHAMQFGATMEVLASYFGYNYAITAPSNATPDFFHAPRTFNSFYELANEASWSRIYSGTQYRQDLELGLEEGTNIGRHFNDLILKK